MTDSLIDRLRTFAEADKTIIALTKGNDPDDDNTQTVVYYFVSLNPYSAERADRISDLDINLSREGYSAQLSEVPPVNIQDYLFLGEVIWRRK